MGSWCFFAHPVLAVIMILNFMELINANCPAPPVILHASNDAGIGSDFAEYTEVTYKCENGYIPVDSFKKFICLSGIWNNPIGFSCEGRGCPFLTSPDNGRLLQFDFTFPNVIDVKCIEGYQISTWYDHVTCQADGQWDSPTPTCSVIECPSLSQPVHGNMMQPHLNGRLNIYKSQVIFRCDYKYRIIGSSTRTCLADGYWSGEQTTCEDIQCLKPDIGFGIIDVAKTVDSYTMTTFYGLDFRIVVYCHTHATLKGSSSILTCGAEGSWEPKNVYCFGHCLVELPEEAVIIPEIIDRHIKHDTVFHLKCSHGYRPADSNHIHCNNSILSRSDLQCDPDDYVTPEPFDDQMVRYAVPVFVAVAFLIIITVIIVVCRRKLAKKGPTPSCAIIIKIEDNKKLSAEDFKEVVQSMVIVPTNPDESSIMAV